MVKINCFLFGSYKNYAYLCGTEMKQMFNN